MRLARGVCAGENLCETCRRARLFAEDPPPMRGSYEEIKAWVSNVNKGSPKPAAEARAARGVRTRRARRE